MKMKIKILLGFLLFFITILDSYGFDINLSTNTNQAKAGESFNFQIRIEGELSGNVEIKEIKGIENFDIVNSSKSQSSSTSMVISNGETQTKSKTTFLINYMLRAKKEGDFTLGPVVVENSLSEEISDSVNISINGKSLFINNSANSNIPNVNNNDDYSNKIEYKKAEKNNPKRHVSYLSLLLIFIFLSLIIALIYIFLKYKDKVFNNITKQNKYEENIIKEVIYPEVDDIDFNIKIENILKDKLKEKYNIVLPNNKTFSDALGELDKNISIYEKEKIKKLTDLITKLKYSNKEINKSEILELLKNI